MFSSHVSVRILFTDVLVISGLLHDKKDCYLSLCFMLALMEKGLYIAILTSLIPRPVQLLNRPGNKVTYINKFTFIHVCSFSRKVIWLEVSTTNNDPSVIAGYYLHAVEKYGNYTMYFAIERI